MIIETTSTLGASMIKGLTAEIYEINAQVDKDYSLANSGALGIENNDGTSIFKTMTSDKARETISGISQIGNLQQTSQGEDYKRDSRIPTYNTEFDWVKYTNGITITEEDRDDRIVSEKLSETRTLLISGKRTINQHMFDLFNYGFTAQASLPDHLTFYGDGTPLFSTIHPVKGTGGTQSNASAVGLPLSETNLEVARLALRGQVGDKNAELLNYGNNSLVLLVPPALEKLALQITRSKKRSGTANNDLNIYDGASITVMSSQLISAAAGGSDTQWFLLDSMMSPATFGQRRALTLGSPYVDNDNKNLNFDISARYKVGPKDFRGTWASKGDGIAYSA